MLEVPEQVAQVKSQLRHLRDGVVDAYWLSLHRVSQVPAEACRYV